MDALFVLLLFVATYIDIKKREIPDTVCIFVGIISLFDLHLFGIFAALPLFIGAMHKQGIGGGDVKLTAAVGLFLGFSSTIYGLIIGLSITTIISIISKIYIKVTKQEVQLKTVPLAPFLSIGFLTTHLIF